MQNNLRNRSVALASTFALALTGIVATAPAANAVSPVELKPTRGVNLGAFITDQFLMDINIPSGTPAKELAIKIDNPKMENLEISFPDEAVTKVTLRAFTATGVEVSLATGRIDAGLNTYNDDDSNTNTVDFTDASDRSFDVDFDVSGTADDVTSLLIVDVLEDDGSNGNKENSLQHIELGIKVLKDDGNSRAYGDGNQGDITVTAWSDLEPTPDPTTVDSATSSGPKTVKFYDPKGVAIIPSIERFVKDGGTLVENDSDSTALGAKMRFIRPDLNLDQVNLSNWAVTVKSDAAIRTITTTDVAQRSGTGSTGPGNDGTKAHDLAGAIYRELGSVNSEEITDDIDADGLYTVEVAHTTADSRVFRSSGFAMPTNDETRSIFASVTDTENAEQDTLIAPVAGGTITQGLNDASADLRPGTASFTYKARLYNSDGAIRDKVASQNIFAVVTANSFLPTGTEYTISGSSETITAANQAVIVSGLTDSDGDYEITVTSSNPVALTGYTVDFYSVDSGDDLTKATDASDSGSSFKTAVDSGITATYKTSVVSGSAALTLDSNVLAGSTVTIGATAKDSFGQETNLSGTKALYVTAQGTSTADLDETVAVGDDGTASISFANYVASGESDVVTVYLHTGATFVSGDEITSEVASLYNPAGVAAVNAPDSASVEITYDDFITGKASATNVAPNDGELDVTGTVVDANGAGVPGAVVTVDADGFQLREKGVGNYFQDTITFTADAAGRFTVRMWAHTVNTTGTDITITSGGQSATTTVKTYLPTGLSGGNLAFDMSTPANIDVNRTYAIELSLTDKWGNPVSTDGTAVQVQGTGSVNINSDSTSATSKDFGKDGTVTVFLRSIKDIEGPGSIVATLETFTYTAYGSGTLDTAASATVDEVTTDVVGTVWDETLFSKEIEVDVNVGDAVASSADQKVNAGSFKGYVAVYAKGYEGQRLSAKIGNDWVIVDPIVNNEGANLHRTTDFTGAGVDIAVRIYIDRVLVDTINLTTK